MTYEVQPLILHVHNYAACTTVLYSPDHFRHEAGTNSDLKVAGFVWEKEQAEAAVSKLHASTLHAHLHPPLNGAADWRQQTPAAQDLSYEQQCKGYGQRDLREAQKGWKTDQFRMRLATLLECHCDDVALKHCVLCCMCLRCDTYGGKNH